MVKGLLQRKDIDYSNVLSLVVKLTTVQIILGILRIDNFHLQQLDVKVALLHGDLEEEIYMMQPEGFETQRQKGHVCRLNKVDMVSS